MKKFYILMLASILLPGVLSAQTSITLTFTATLNGDHQPLDSIFIENLTQGGDTTLYGNDTVLVLQQPIGISDPGQQPVGGIILQPAFPNPFNGSTTIGFYLAQQEQVALGLYDPLGREVASLEDMFPAGGHRISLHAGNGGFYLFSVETPRFRQVQKLMPLGRSNVDCRIEYAGWQPGSSGMKKDRANFLWAPGDNLRFIGYTFNGADTIDAAPVQSTQYIFQFLPQSPPPVANFSASDTAIHQNDTVQFTDLSLHSPTTWKWYFGDGDSSVLQNPSHIYTTTGIFSVSLIAGNAAGYDTITKINHIVVAISCPPTVTDINGNIYNTVQIGTQCWMKENLKARNYRNGTAIPNITDNSIWGGLSTGARCWYNNDSATFAATYGALYNWHAVDDTNGLCPTGWHVPTDPEWQTLEMFLGMSLLQASLIGLRGTDEGGKMKEAGLAHWDSPNSCASNSSGFTALPGGGRMGPNGGDVGMFGNWWSSSAYSSTYAWFRYLCCNHCNVNRGSSLKYSGLSVRCVRDGSGSSTALPTISTNSVSATTATSAVSGGIVPADGGAAVTVRGVCWSTSQNPTIVNDTSSDGSGTGAFISNITGLNPSTTYYMRAYATNSAGTAYGNQEDFITTSSTTGVPCPGMPVVTDFNGNVYNTVQIGTQCWMKENLKARNYQNGTSIPNITDSTAWAALSTGARCWYNNDSATYAATYGALYNWYAVDDANGLCPTGWHVPTDPEWQTMEMSLGMSQAQVSSNNYRGTDQGGKMKEAGLTHWNSPNTGATNSSGFTALPGGSRYIFLPGDFYSVASNGSWWSSSAHFSTSFAWYRELSHNKSSVSRSILHKESGFSVRCVRDY